jgi:hypothetical protein
MLKLVGLSGLFGFTPLSDVLGDTWAGRSRSTGRAGSGLEAGLGFGFPAYSPGDPGQVAFHAFVFFNTGHLDTQQDNLPLNRRRRVCDSERRCSPRVRGNCGLGYADSQKPKDSTGHPVSGHRNGRIAGNERDVKDLDLNGTKGPGLGEGSDCGSDGGRHCVVFLTL